MSQRPLRRPIRTPRRIPQRIRAAGQNPASGGDGKKITKSFILSKDSLSEYGDAAFDHESHAFQMYSPDGKSVVGCVECHHTDQPKSALKPPLLTSERDVALTLESWRSSPQKVNECRACHFQDGNVPDGKEMPTATYTDGAKSTKKDLNNELAYHINCNTCHDAAFKLRPELKKKAGFSTSKDCTICHKAN
ncbi:MAG: cytochrome c3 family protein [Chloracidobacterium sp.]|nr:cytochrome c3 family protein [Chloracidobacterium sp.]